MAEEYLFSIELNQDKTKEHWDPQPEGDEEQNFGVDQKLIVKMVILGKDAKVGEQNIVQIEAMGLKGKFKTPIAILEMGKCPQLLLDLSFPDSPVTFELISGSGPVHIVGHNLLDVDEEEVEVDNYDDEDDEKDEKEVDEDDEEEEEEIEEPKKRKNKQPAKNQVNKKQKKN